MSSRDGRPTRKHGAACDPSPMSVFRSVSMIDVLQQDPRPALILDLHEHSEQLDDAILEPLFYNKAFEQAGLLEVVRGQSSPLEYGQPSSSTYAAFSRWAVQKDSPDVPRGFSYNGMSWTFSTINERWRMVNAIREQQKSRSTGAFRKASWGPNAIMSAIPKDPKPGSQSSGSTADMRSSAANFLHELPISSLATSSFDWTAETVPEDVSEHILLARSIDWGKTPLGPMSSWSPCLRNTLNLLMATPAPAICLWGPDYNVIYNESYIAVASAKHPTVFGQPAKQGFAEAFDQFEPFLERCKHLGRGATFEDMQFFLDRGVCDQEETYFNLSISPVSEGIHDAGVTGFYEQITETTPRKLAERRMTTILEVGEQTSKAHDLSSFWQSVASALSTNPSDVSFAAIYSVIDGGDTIDDHSEPARTSPSSKLFRLEQHTGLPPDHASIPPFADRYNMQGFTSYFEEAYKVGDMLYCSIQEDTLSSHLMEGLYSKTFQDPCSSIVILPIFPTTGHASHRNTALGFIVLGLNTRRPFDDGYQQFIKVLRRQLTTSLASVLLLEEEIRNGRTIAEQAALDQKLLEERLSARTQELEARSLQLKHFTDSAGVGISVLEFGPDFPKGRYAYRNDKWWELTSGDKEIEETIPVGETLIWQRIHKEDLDLTRRHWQNLMTNRENYVLTFRIAKSADANPEIEEDYRWLLAYSLSVLDDDGKMISCITSLTDISSQKAAEATQKRLASEAIQAKQQQENFIDVTSHEMRNPLSAIMISADDIITSLRPLESQYADLRDALKSAIDAAQIIVDCAQHQRRIVDDILTISKLDSGLFSFAPVPTSVETVIHNLLKMIEPELTAGGITRNLEIDPSFQILGIDQVLLDPSRLLQILINLLTNAVKFTKFAATRNITIYLRATLERPNATIHGHQYLPQRHGRDRVSPAKDAKSGRKVYLQFDIEDSGKGLSASEKDLLFQRFSQAPKTHVNYGGSGLGLFISRELVELQGGQIGVESAGTDRGCEFSFFVEAQSVEVAGDYAMTNDNNIMALNQAQSTYAIRSAVHDSMDIDLTTPGLDEAQPFFSSSNHGQPKHALVVEDNIVNQRVLKKQLEKLSYKVSIANHGQEALDILSKTTYARNHPVDAPDITIVLLDSEMPVLDGLTAVRQIREMQRQGVFIRHVPVIGITANVRMEQIQDALAAGMDDVVAKPFRVPELVKQIDRLKAELDAKNKDNG